MDADGAGLEPDDDPWGSTSAADVRAAFDAHLIEEREIRSPSGRFFRPSGDVSIGSVLLEVASVDEDGGCDVDLDGMSEIEEVLARFTGMASQDVVSCWIENSRVSGSWALCEFQLAGRGFLYHRPDWGIGADESLPILGAWEPADDPSARRECILWVYGRNWCECGLPPAMGEFAIGEPHLLLTAILRVLEDDPAAWEQVFNRLRDCADLADEPTSTLETVAQLSESSISHVREAVRSVVDRSGELALRVRSDSSSANEQRIIVALLVNCIVPRR